MSVTVPQGEGGKNKGYGFVEYADVVSLLHGYPLEGQPCLRIQKGLAKDQPGRVGCQELWRDLFTPLTHSPSFVVACGGSSARLFCLTTCTDPVLGPTAYEQAFTKACNQFHLGGPAVLQCNYLNKCSWTHTNTRRFARY